MLRYLFAAVGIWFFGNVAYSAIAPYAQSVRELSAVVRDQRVAQALGQDRAIDQIVRSPGHAYGYRITSGRCDLFVGVHYEDSRGIPTPPGVGRMVISPGELMCGS